jgi:hypothetical protein
MDKTRLSRRRLIENELLLRRKNESAKDALQKYYGDELDEDSALLEFYCECSNDDCEEHVELTISEYEKHHERNDRFVVLPQHDLAAIEKIVAKTDGYIVVQKFDLPK